MQFFDTNILVYAQDARDPGKQAIARSLIRQAIASGEFTISTQVMQEFYSVATRKLGMEPAHAALLLAAWAENEVVDGTPGMLFRAFTLQQDQHISVWDALVVQAALDAGCSTLYSEDLQQGMEFATMTVTDPFRVPHAVHEPRAPYAPKRKRAARRAGT